MNCNPQTPDIYKHHFTYDWGDWKKTPGPWWVLENRGTSWDKVGNALTTRKSAIIRMPCGHIGGVGSHTIADDGTVSPSILCMNGPGNVCDKGYHDYGKLEGWVP